MVALQDLCHSPAKDLSDTYSKGCFKKGCDTSIIKLFIIYFGWMAELVLLQVRRRSVKSNHQNEDKHCERQWPGQKFEDNIVAGV